MHKIRFTVLLATVLLFLLPVSAFALRAGDLDTTFNALKGYAMKNIGVGSSQAHGTAIQKDGKIVVIGEGQGMESVIYVLRYNPDGTLDTSFGRNGTAKLSGGDGRAVMIQPDGKIVVVGSIGNWDYRDLLVMRLNIDGSVDRTFGSDGIVRYDTGLDECAHAVALQPDGKIIVAGGTDWFTQSDVIILRLTEDGALDKSFGSSGVITYDGGNLDIATGIAVQPNGKIVVVGTIGYGDTHLVTNIDVLVIRFNSNGSLDTNFGTDGIVTYDGTDHYQDFGAAVALQPDGKILITGGSFDSVLVLRYNRNGTLDTSFGNNGAALYDNWLYQGGWTGGSAIALQPDSKIIVFGEKGGWPNLDMVVLRFNSNGTLDNSFSSNGVAVYKGGQVYNGGGLALQPDGKIVVAGSRSNATRDDILVLRYKSNGILDDSFSSDGTAIYKSNVGSSDKGNAVAIQPDGKIVVVGTGNIIRLFGNSNLIILRYQSDGTLDRNFGLNGMATYDYEGNAVAIQPDGKIVVTGQTGSKVLLLRFNLDGSLEGSNSLIVGKGTAAALQADGKIIVVGKDPYTDSLIICRFNSDLSVDKGFGNDGVASYVNAYYNFNPSVVLQKDEKIVIVDTFLDQGISKVMLLRYNSNGTLDAGFGNNGIVTFGAGMTATGKAAAIQTDGKIVVVISNSLSVLTARVNVNGTLDTTFGTTGIATFETTDSSGYAIAIQPDGKIMLAGARISGLVNGIQTSSAFALRYNSNGILDRGFGTEGTRTYHINISSSGNAVAIQRDGKIVITGLSFNPNTHSYDTLVMRILGDAPPTAPSTLTASAASSTAISLTWKDNSDNETGFKIERKQGGCGSNTEWKQITSAGADTEGFTDTNLMPSFPYAYRVRAFNKAGGSAYSNCASTMTLPIIH